MEPGGPELGPAPVGGPPPGPGGMEDGGPAVGGPCNTIHSKLNTITLVSLPYKWQLIIVVSHYGEGVRVGLIQVTQEDALSEITVGVFYK